MSPTPHVPHRRCVGCGTVAPQAELLRLGLVDGVVTPDPAHRLPGRGAYVHGPDCAARATTRKAWSRSFRRAVTAPDDNLEVHPRDAVDAH